MKMKEFDFDSNWSVESARKTLFKELHVAEFWMPQIAGERNCNLRCKHCYVFANGRPRGEILSPKAYLGVLNKLMTTVAPFCGKWDIVFPGMEPLLSRNGVYIWPMIAEASRLGARSIGITTNAVLMSGKVLGKVLDSGITTINVSLDGNRSLHDEIRGKGMFEITTENTRKLCVLKGARKVITNTTVMGTNRGCLSEISRISADMGCDYAAFHPFEIAVNADNSLDSRMFGIKEAFTKLIREFEANKTGSIVIEFEASTAGYFFKLFETGMFDGFQILEDESQFRFLRKCVAGKECLVNIVFYPHHFVRTVRVMDDGSLSSCRMIAKHGWHGVGNLATQSFEGICNLPETIQAAADIWNEYERSLAPISRKTLGRFIELNKKGGE